MRGDTPIHARLIGGVGGTPRQSSPALCGVATMAHASPSSRTMETEDRIAELEAKLSFAEDMLETLNLTVFRQQERLAQLEARIEQLGRQLRAVQPAEPSRAEQRPPHY